MNQLVKKEFKLMNTSFECYIFQTVDQNGRETFWFKGNDVAKFLGYRIPKKAIIDHVFTDWKKNWNELKVVLDQDHLNIPSNWQPNAIFISEPGVYALVTRSKLPAAIQFTRWVYEEVLPTLRREGQYRIVREKDNKIKELTNELILTKENTITLSNKIVSLAKDVIAKPTSEKLLHTLAVHKLDNGYISFTRCQKRSFNKALNKLFENNPNSIELFHTEYVPNGINILNCFKEILKHSDISYEPKHNKIKVSLDSNNIVSLLNNILESKT